MILPIDKALQLYKMLAPFINENIKDEFELSMDLVTKIRESDSKGTYADAVVLLSGIDLYSLVDYDAKDILEMFIQGVKNNRLLYLRQFAEQVGIS